MPAPQEPRDQAPRRRLTAAPAPASAEEAGRAEADEEAEVKGSTASDDGSATVDSPAVGPTPATSATAAEAPDGRGDAVEGVEDPAAAPTAEHAVRPEAAASVPVAPATEAWPTATTPLPADQAAPSGPSAKRAAVLGAVAGAVTAALVATGIGVALDDDPAPSRSAPVATPVTTGEGALDIQGILAKVQSSVVAIETSQSTSRGVFEGAGSGIILSEDGLVLTNAHVISNAAAVGSRGDITVVLPDGSREAATLVGLTPGDDLGLIQIEDVSGLVPAELGSSDALRVGDEVIAIGNALNLGAEPTVTRGIVSAKDRQLSAQNVELEGLIQTDAAINPGNSGGPLVNAAGQVVGVNTAIVADAQNLGFSIAIDRARPIIEDLKEGKGTISPDQAFLGVSSSDVDELNDQVLERFDVDVDDGAFVIEVVPGSAADDAGIEVGDVIVEVGGHDVEGSEDVRDAVTSHEPGDDVDIEVLRDGEARTLTVTLGRRGDQS